MFQSNKGPSTFIFMFEPSHFYPTYVRELITELENSQYADSVLPKYKSYTREDPSLHQVLNDFGAFDSNPGLVSSDLVIAKLDSIYRGSPKLFSSDLGYFEGLSGEFMRTYYENHIDILGSPFDFGLDTSNLMFEDSSLSTMWSETQPGPEPLPELCPPALTNTRSRNGLKALSWRIKQIVQRQEKISYKLVAEELLRELEMEQDSNKNEKNIRRRVYDALNVLVAVGVLEKNQKKVVPQEHSSIEWKKKHLYKLALEYLNVSSLVNHNRVCKTHSEKVHLPFKLVAVAKGKAPLEIETTITSKTLKIQTLNKFKVLDSQEVVKELKLPSRSLIPTEVWELCSPDI